MEKHLLIISNNVLSETKNNGKTLLSFIDGIKDLKVSQLYFSGEVPRVPGYCYFQISDKDIIKGLIAPSKRGRAVEAEAKTNKDEDDFSIKKTVGRNELTLRIRDYLWKRKWNSLALNTWLDVNRPDAVLFVAGDALFPYEIAEEICKKFSCRLTVYVTDDYIMPRKNESHIHRIRRAKIRNELNHILKRADCFYTISEAMKKTYKEELDKDSYIALNMTEDMKGLYDKTDDEIVLTYTGSLYYGRDRVLGEIAKAVKEYNNIGKLQKAKLEVYCNNEPSAEIKKKLFIYDSIIYGGSLDKQGMKEKLNTSDLLVFVESFDDEQKEKVKYSLSTKVSEYMSVEKPILAIGPKGIGSIDYLSDVAICVNDPTHIYSTVFSSLKSLSDERKKLDQYGKKARKKYLTNHNKKENQKNFITNVM